MTSKSLDEVSRAVKAYGDQWRYGPRNQSHLNQLALRSLEAIEKFLKTEMGDRT